MKILINLKSIVVFFIFILFFSFAGVEVLAFENLDELELRKARITTNSWGKEYLEDPETLVWQSETFSYTDNVSGKEVWRLSSTNGLKNSLPDISWAHWSADGKRFSFGSNRDTSAIDSPWEVNDNASYQGSVMMMLADGSYLRPADNAPHEVYVHRRFLNWSPVEPDVYYAFGEYGGESEHVLYKTIVNDISISKSSVLTMPVEIEHRLINAMSPDGKKLIAMSGGRIYPITLLPTVLLDDSDGWIAYRQLDDYWGQTPVNTAYTFHNKFLRGSGSNLWLYFIPEGYSSWWRIKTSGTDVDGGPKHIFDNTAPYDWGEEVEPVFTGAWSRGECVTDYRSPWNCDSDSVTGPEQYASHPGYDRWGEYVAGVGANTPTPRFIVWDLENHNYISENIPAIRYSHHLDWSAWSDYFVASPSGVGENNIIYVVKYDGTDTRAIADVYYRESGSTDYNSNPRVTQSPDGTKAVYHSDFLYGIANAWDVFYAVAYNPHPPEITQVTNGVVRFDWRTDQIESRGYTQRGWPNEEIDNPPPPRETSKFRLWKSEDGINNWEPLDTVEANIFDKYDFSNGVWLENKYWEIIDPNPSGYYAVTSVEHSGLESQTLSNIVNLNGIELSPYPEDPKADTNIISNHNQKLVRYYNIYAQDNEIPTAIQQHRISSIPTASEKQYIDWLGNQDGSTKYLVTAVDTQGNESEPLNHVAICKQAPAIADGQYTITWENDSSQVICSDVDQNSSINTIDAILTFRNSLDLDMTNTSWNQTDTTGDVNCDGNSNAIDAVLLLRYSLGPDMSETDWCE